MEPSYDLFGVDAGHSVRTGVGEIDPHRVQPHTKNPNSGHLCTPALITGYAGLPRQRREEIDEVAVRGHETASSGYPNPDWSAHEPAGTSALTRRGEFHGATFASLLGCVT
jgi:hypothetical protein